MTSAASMSSERAVAVDARALNVPFLRGMGRYLSTLLAEIDKLDRFSWNLISDRPDIPFQLPTLQRATQTMRLMKGWRLQSWEQFVLPYTAWKSGAQLMFCPNTIAPWWQPAPTVVTVHDTLPWEAHEYPNEHRMFWMHVVPRSLRKASAIVVPSQSSCDDLISLWPDLAERVNVIPHGLSRSWITPGPTLSHKLDLPSNPFFLYVGGAAPRKRLEWAIRVFNALQEPDCHLLVLGGGLDTIRDLAGIADSSTLERIRPMPFVAEDDLPSVFAQAVAVIYPTLYEGFGFPALEAQAVGTPVLFSPLGSLAELTGPGAITLPAEDFGAWVESCRMVYESRRSDRTTNHLARTWASRFTWEESARKHLEVFSSVMSRN